MRLDVTAATYYAFKWLQVNDEQPIVIDIYGAERAWYDTDKLTEALNNLLLFERVDWEIAGGEFVRRGNSILHAEVVQPALTLLANSPQFNVASEGFQSALNSLSHNREGEAVTMAATSLQEFFRGLGANGNSLPDQLNEAQKKGVITKADRSLLKPLVDWMNADRSDHGTAHKVTNGAVTRDDAWLMLHVAAALMVRLSNGEPRM
jgi:hypothetical protein